MGGTEYREHEIATRLVGTVGEPQPAPDGEHHRGRPERQHDRSTGQRTGEPIDPAALSLGDGQERDREPEDGSEQAGAEPRQAAPELTGRGKGETSGKSR